MLSRTWRSRTPSRRQGASTRRTGSAACEEGVQGAGLQQGPQARADRVAADVGQGLVEPPLDADGLRQAEQPDDLERLVHGLVLMPSYQGWHAYAAVAKALRPWPCGPWCVHRGLTTGCRGANSGRRVGARISNRFSKSTSLTRNLCLYCSMRPPRAARGGRRTVCQAPAGIVLTQTGPQAAARAFAGVLDVLLARARVDGGGQFRGAAGRHLVLLHQEAVVGHLAPGGGQAVVADGQVHPLDDLLDGRRDLELGDLLARQVRDMFALVEKLDDRRGAHAAGDADDVADVVSHQAVGRGQDDVVPPADLDLVGQQGRAGRAGRPLPRARTRRRCPWSPGRPRSPRRGSGRRSGPRRR